VFFRPLPVSHEVYQTKDADFRNVYLQEEGRNKFTIIKNELLVNFLILFLQMVRMESTF